MRRMRSEGVLVERWRCEYNHLRPHSSLGYRPPAPEAVEGRVIAWRYTVEAVSAVHRAFAGRAVLTPLRFEV